MNFSENMKLIALAILTIALAHPVLAAEPNKLAAFEPGALWLDNNGKHINAHGGGMLFHNGVYYWYGEHKIAGDAGNVAHVGVHCYSSGDLYNWKDAGIALPVSQDPASDITEGCIIERPKVIYNAKTSKFVMWFHLELKGQGYNAARSGVAVADQPAGPFTYLKSFRPDDSMARDQTLFVDDDGKAYQLYASEGNWTLHISLLTDDYLAPAGKFVRVFEKREMEAPAICKRDGKYYFIASGCSGWDPNDARAAVAPSIWGPWKELGNPCVGTNPNNRMGPNRTFGGQSTYIFPVQGKKDAYIAMFDLWRPQNAIDGRYLWLPIKFTDAGFKIEWANQWDLGVFDLMTSGAAADDAAKPPVTGQTVFTLKTTPVAPKAIVSQQAVPDAAKLLDGKPVRFQPGPDAAEVVVDFGREIVGTIRFAVRAEAASKLEVRYGEALQEVHRNNDYAARWYKRPIDHLDVKAGAQELTNYGRRAFRYIRLIVPAGAAPFTLESVQATLQHYPVHEAGTFRCSDPQLNKIWELAAYSTKLCMQQYYEDGIKRDGLLWISDYRVQYLCNALLYGDRDLARKSLFLMAASQNPDGSIPAQASRAGASQHPSNINYMPGIPRGVNNWILVNYCLDYIGCLRDYYRFTGDRDALTQLWPAVRKLLPFLMKQDPASLKPLANFITDARYGESWWGSHGVLEMQYVIAMQDASYLAQVIGDDAIRRQCDDYIPRQREHVMQTYFDQAEGIFLDEPNKKLTTSWHVNSFSLLAGLGDYARQARQLDKTSSQVRPATAGFMLYWTMEAKFRAGMAAAALDDMRKVYGHMLGFGATTTWEKCDLTVGDHPNETEAAGSRCHGWSAGPAYLLPAHVLGVQPAAPGFAAVVIDPQLGGLQWAEGVVPTPKGLIRLRWDGGPSLSGSVTLPDGMTGEVKLPGRKIPLKPGMNRITAD